MGLARLVASSGFLSYSGSQFGVVIVAGIVIVTGVGIVTGIGIVAGIGIVIVIVFRVVFGIVIGIVLVVCLYGLFFFGSSYYVGRWWGHGGGCPPGPSPCPC